MVSFIHDPNAGIKIVEYPTDSEEYRWIMEAQSERHRELNPLRTNNRTYQLNLGIQEKNIAAYKKQIVDLQAQLLASQDRITELQQQVLNLRQTVKSKERRRNNHV